MEAIQCTHERRVFNRRRIREEDVTPKALKNTHIDEVLDMIMHQEEVVVTNITIENVKGLLNLYQKAIEHFSALNAP